MHSNFVRLEQTLSINFKFNGIFVPFPKREKILTEQYRINLNFVINNLNPFSPVPLRKICHKIISLIFLKTPEK
jgi:hypothetical protein